MLSHSCRACLVFLWQWFCLSLSPPSLPSSSNLSRFSSVLSFSFIVLHLHSPYWMSLWRLWDLCLDVFVHSWCSTFQYLLPLLLCQRSVYYIDMCLCLGAIMLELSLFISAKCTCELAGMPWCTLAFRRQHVWLVSSPVCETQGWNSGCQDWWQTPLAAEPSGQPCIWNVKFR